MNSPDDRGTASPLGMLIVSLMLLAAGGSLLPAFTLVRELREATRRLDENLLLLWAVHRTISMQAEELQTEGANILRGTVEIKTRPLKDGRIEITLRLPQGRSEGSLATPERSLTFYLNIPEENHQ